MLYCVQPLSAQVSVSFCTRLLSLACTSTDHMHFNQLQTNSICQTVLFVPEFLPHLHRHRLQGPLDWLRRMTMVLSPEPTPRCTWLFVPWHPRPPKTEQVVGVPLRPPIKNLVFFRRFNQYNTGPTFGSTGTSARSSTDSGTPLTRPKIVHVRDFMRWTVPNVVSIGSPEKYWSNREEHSSRSQPDDISLR